MKIISKALLVYGGFFLCWFLLAQVDFVSFFEIEQNKVFAEDKIGDIIWDEIEQNEDVIYDDSISTEDIHQSSNIDNLKIYTYGDTVGRLKRVAFEQICNELEDESSQIFDSEFDKSITNFQNKISQIQYISPLCECVVFPILSRITTIPYNHFKSISPTEAMLLSLYIQSLMRKVFKN